MGESMDKMILTIASLNGFLAVALGAFGAHGLKSKLSPEMMSVFETAVQYQMFHVLALFVSALALSQYGPIAVFKWSAWLFLAGILLFSGSLYCLSMTGIRGLGMITPLGGAAFLAGWTLLAYGFVTR